MVGETDHGRPIFLLIIGRQDAHLHERPGFWLDGGTHAAEWTSVMSTLFTVSGWLEKLAHGDTAETQYFETHTAYVMPCIAPDGYNAMIEGSPFIRSTLRPPRNGAQQIGLVPKDLTGDGAIRWMRWRHPAGAYVVDDDNPYFMRPRTVDDDPSDAYVFCQEGSFVNWDGNAWVEAQREFGLDLNRNFPAHWAPFSMFGMDGGQYPLSVPESRAVVETFTRFPHISAAVTNHTYTGCLLTQPYRKDSPLPRTDIQLMHRLAMQAVDGTDYTVYKTYPDFAYDPEKAIVGVWADALGTTFGVPGYTLELWSPFGYAGVEYDDPAAFFSTPDPDKIAQLIGAFVERGDTATPWQTYEHSQLGTVEIGGIDYMRTIRNPPEVLLADECEKGTVVANRIRRSVARVEASTTVTARADDLYEIKLTLWNMGFLSTSGLDHGASLPGTPVIQAELSTQASARIVSGAPIQTTEHLSGWGSFAPGGVHSVYPSLPSPQQRVDMTWLVQGVGDVTVDWLGGRGGSGTLCIALTDTH